MFNPTKRLGDEEDGSHTVIAVGIPTHKATKFNPSSRLGDEGPDAEPDGEAGDPDELMLKAAEGICTKLNVGAKAAPALKDYLEAFCRAADSKPHEEGGDETDSSKEN